MATLAHLPPLQFLCSNELLATPLPIFYNKIHCYSHQKLPRICASFTKESRASRKVKSDEDLFKDIKEFLSAVGLPQDHVPSTKELSQNGRQDLANIVRRRGYKFIRELLATQIHQRGEKVKDLADAISLSSESTKVEKHKEGEATELERQTEDFVGDVSPSSEAMEDDKNINHLTDDISLSSEVTGVVSPKVGTPSALSKKVTGVERQTQDMAEYVSLSSEVTKNEEIINYLTDDISLLSEATEVLRQTGDLVEVVSLSDEVTKDEEVGVNLAEDVSITCEGTISTDNIRSPEMSIELKPDDLSYTGPYASSNVSLEEKVAKFVQEGELNDFEDNGFEILKRSPSADSTEFIKSEDAIESKSDSIHGAHEDLAFSGAGGSDLSNGHINLSCQPVEHPSWETNTSRAEILSNEKVMVVDHNEEPDVQAQKADNQAEISRLSYMLHQKELELTKLKEQIEKEKLALSILQSKAEKEISEAQKLISEKDAELRAAEESLSGLKEVEIQCWGEGEIIEVAGSFNGWQQRIKMDPLPCSSISDLTGSRKSRLWRTVLWLYPGVYEIKFITDGHWTIDPQRESVTRGSIHNNILRVDR